MWNKKTAADIIGKVPAERGLTYPVCVCVVPAIGYISSVQGKKRVEILFLLRLANQLALDGIDCAGERACTARDSLLARPGEVTDVLPPHAANKCITICGGHGRGGGQIPARLYT